MIANGFSGGESAVSTKSSAVSDASAASNVLAVLWFVVSLPIIYTVSTRVTAKEVSP